MLHDFDDVSGGDSDQLGDPLQYTIEAGNDDNIFEIGNKDGQLVIKDNSGLDNTKNDFTLFIQASDGVNNTSVATSIQLITTNEKPVASDDTILLDENAIAEQGTAGNGILSNDSDPNNDSLTINQVRTGDETDDGSYGIIGEAKSGTYGRFTLNGDGTYSYSANLAAADTLAQGELGIDSFTYWVSDGRESDQAQINIHVNGLNDPPHVVDAIAKKKYTEGQGETIIIDGSLTVTDVDDSKIESASVTISTGYQPTEDVLGFSDTSEISGSWNAASGQLSLSGTATKNAYAAALATVTYTNSDDLNPSLGHRTVSWQLNDGDAASNTASSIIDVGGINDSPESQTDSGSVDAGSSLNVTAGSGLLSNDSDPESDNLSVSDIRTGGESQSGTDGSIATALTGNYGQLTVSSDGSYTYSANQAAADALAEGATAIDVFTYTLNDGTDNDLGELTITVTGTNNAPSGSDDSKSVNENESLDIKAISGVLINDTDVDGDSLTITAVQNASRASSRALLRRASGRQKKGRKTIFLARSSQFSSSALPEITGTYGELTLNSDGSYVYDANQSATDALNEGDSVSDSFTYTLSDGKTTSSAKLEIVVTGINDYPSITTPSAGTIDEVAGSTQTRTSGLTGTFTATDVDADASLEYGILGGSTVDSTTSLTGNYGTLELDTSTGEYTYTPDSSSIEALNAGQSVSDEFRISVSDSMALDSTEFKVLITGASEQAAGSGADNNHDNSQDTQTPTPPTSPPTETGLSCDFKRQEKVKGTLFITGSQCNDTLLGNNQRDVLRGRDGADKIIGQRGKDLLRGHQDADTIRGGRGDDNIAGGENNDRLFGNRGKDRIKGQRGQDIIRGGLGEDTLHGGAGVDILLGERGDDEIRGGKEADQLLGGKNNDLLIGRRGGDVIEGRSGNDTIKGGKGDDIIKTGRGADLIHLSRGHDQILDFKPKRGDRLTGKNKFSFEATELDGNLILIDTEKNTQITLHNLSLNTAFAVHPELFS